ncbi:MAG: ComEC/Rec2 family competence protein [Acidobacteria bacterium]|nr:ComEC/Rec2 family competence protein [Acidobacteriota bacterium]
MAAPRSQPALSHQHPLIAPVAALALGILLARFVPLTPRETLPAIAATFVLGMIAYARGALRVAQACGLAGFVFAGALTAWAHQPPPPPTIDATAREVLIVEGCVVEPPAVSEDRARFVMELDRDARAQVTLYTKPGETLPALRYGQHIELDGKVRKPRNFGNPGAFDYANYLARQNIYWTVSANAGAVRVLPGTCGTRFGKFIMDLRAAALDRIQRIYPDDEFRSGMMQAILIGQSFQLQKVWTDQWRSTGTFHAIVISGTHVAVLAAVFLFLLRLCFIPQPWALTLTTLAAWLYALVTGWQAPCIRSAAGLTLYLIASYFYRETRILNLLAAIALGFLVLDPGQLFDASFQLTFLAVGFLGAFAAPAIRATSGPLAAGLRDLANRDRDLHAEPRVAQFRIEMRLLAAALRVPCAMVAWPARGIFYVYEIVLTSAVVQLGLALPMVEYFHRVGVSGLSANALVVPAMGFVVPLGFAAVLTGWAPLAKLAGWFLGLAQAVVEFHARIEPGWRIPTPPVWLAVAVAAALIATAAAGTRTARTLSGAAVAVLLAVLLVSPFAPAIVPRQLELTAIDVGQGDGLFLAFPDGRTMLVDGGGIPVFGRPQRGNLDIGEDVIAPYLWDRGIRRVDVVALTHAHEDHAGGVPALITDFHPAEVWTGFTPDSPEWERVRVAAGRARASVKPLSAPARFSFGGAEIEVLAPFPDYVPLDTPRNNDSLVLRVTYGSRSFLLTGDVERPIEQEMLAAGEVRPADVLKVPHHGSRTSSTDDFLDAVHPAFAVISDGFENSYGHPHAAILDRLEQRHAEILRTDQGGLITIRTDGKRLSVDTYAREAGFRTQR